MADLTNSDQSIKTYSGPTAVKDFLDKNDLTVWDMATACGNCHVGGNLVEMDFQGIRHSMRPKDLTGATLNPFDNYVPEYFTPGGLPAHYVNDRCMNMPVNHDGTPVVAGQPTPLGCPSTTTVVPSDTNTASHGFMPAAAMWAIPATFDNRFNNGTNEVVPANLVGVCSDQVSTTQTACTAAGGTWTTANGWAPPEYVQMGMAVSGQMLMPNVREMDCFMCHLEGYNNVINSVAVQMGYLNAAPSLSSGLMNMFSQTYIPGTWAAAGADMPGFGTPAKLSGSVIARLKAEPPTDNCRQCHTSTTMANFSDMFDKFLSSAPMEYNPASPMASLINGMAMPSYDLNAPFVPEGYLSPEVHFNFTTMSFDYGDASSAAGPYGLFPMALDSSWSMVTQTGQPNTATAGGGKPGMSGPLYYAGASTNDQNALKKATIPFPRADWFKRGDSWDPDQDVHTSIGCGGCHYNGNTSNPGQTQCDPGRGLTRLGGIENGSGPNKIDSRSTMKRCQDCHITGTNIEGVAINTFGAPNPNAAHTAAGLMAEVTTARKLDASGTEINVMGNHLDVIDCTVCHIYKNAMTVRALDSTSGNRYPTLIGIDPMKGMMGMFTDPMGADNLDDATAIGAVTQNLTAMGFTAEAISAMVPDAATARQMLKTQYPQWQPIYGWWANQPKYLPLGDGTPGTASNGAAVNPDWRRKIIAINFTVAQLWEDSANGAEDLNHDGAETDGQTHAGGIQWDPPIQRDMKAGMNFAAGPFGTIPVGFGDGPYASAYNPDFTFTGAFDYVGIYGGNAILTTPEQINTYKDWRANTRNTSASGIDKDWSGVQLVFFGGNPFQVEHNVAPTARYALGMNGCTDCHSSASGFFSGSYDMTGTAIPASAEYDMDGSAGTMANPVASNMFYRPVVDYEVTADKDDLRTGSEAVPKDGSAPFLDVEFDHCLAADRMTVVPCEIDGLENPEAVYRQTEDLDKRKFLYPELKDDEAALAQKIAHLESIDLESSHTAAPGSGPVVLFADDDHDNAGWVGSKPYFAATVDCTLCHDTDLRTTHGNDCATCHSTPVDSLGGWNKGCQQGGCHSEFHEDALTAHQPFAVPDESVNDCTRCHEASSWDVLQTNCLNCHAAPVTGYGSPPVTTSNAQSSYEGTAEIDFSINENGKVGVGRTFYKLDGGEVDSGSKVVVSSGGSHELEFWSVDQYGVSEVSHNTAYFTVSADTTPPTTTSNAQSSYYQGGIITLSGTDESTLGVQKTFYSLNDGPTQSGTTVILPTDPGTITYTLDFWSVDWSGNVEAKNSVTFTVSSGPGTIRLVWWDCDLYPSHAPFGSDKANWTIHRDSRWGAVVASGSGASPGWNGINDVPIPVGSQKYFVRVYWWDSYEGDYEITDIPDVTVTTPGQVVRLSY